MGTFQKKKNRIISFVCIGVFASSLIVAGVITSKLVRTIMNNDTLLALKEQLIIEKNKLQDGEEKDCYTVFVKDDYTLDNGEIFIFKK